MQNERIAHYAQTYGVGANVDILKQRFRLEEGVIIVGSLQEKIGNAGSGGFAVCIGSMDQAGVELTKAKRVLETAVDDRANSEKYQQGLTAADRALAERR